MADYEKNADNQIQETVPGHYEESEQTDEEVERVRQVEKLFQKARAARKPKESKWQENFEFYLGRQWPYRRPTYRHSEVINLVFSTVEATVPLLLDNRPQISFIPEDMGDRELAEAISKVADSDWSRSGWSYVLADILKQGLITGTGVGSLELNPQGNSGIGAIEFKNDDPFTVYPAPDAKDVNDGSCSFFICAKPIPVEKAKALFPEKAHLIKGNIGPGLPSRYERKEFDQTLNANAIRSQEASDDASAAFTTQEGRPQDMSLLIKLWAQDDTIEEVEEIIKCNDGSEKADKVQKKKYPNGRYTIVIDDVLCFDGGNPYDDGLYPYAKFVDYQIPNEFWGMGDVEQAKSPQKIVNRLLSFMMDTIVLMGNPIWVADLGSIDTDQVTNQPGLIVEKQPGTDVHREMGLGLPSNFLSVYQLAVEAYDRIVGLNELTQGNRPQNVSSNVALETLQEAGQTRIRQKARNLEKFLQEIGVLYLSRVMQFYSTPRIITISDEANPLIMKQFKFQIEKDPEDTNMKLATVIPMHQDEMGQVREGQPKKFRTKGIFDVRATVGSNLPFAKAMKSDLAFKLFDRGVLPPRQLLKDIDYPNADKIASEIEKLQEAAAQAKAQQGG